MENRKLIMGIYSPCSEEPVKKTQAIKRVINICIENDTVGDKAFTPVVADTLIKIAAMIKDGTAGNGCAERFVDKNGNVAIILGGRLSAEENIPSPDYTDL